MHEDITPLPISTIGRPDPGEGRGHTYKSATTLEVLMSVESPRLGLRSSQLDPIGEERKNLT